MQINKHVHAVKVPFSITTPSGLYMERFVYVYIIYGTNGVHLIDTGVASEEERIFDYLRNTERKVEDISLIVLTHTHPDHIGAARTIKAETGCHIAVHPAEKEWIENVQSQARERPVPGFDSLVAGSVKVDRILEDGDVFDLGCGLRLQIFHTPGHSKGSISILLLGYMTLFTGDAVPVPGEMPIYEDVLASVSSIRKLKRIEGVRHLLPSWDEPREGDEVYKRMDEGLDYLQRIHDAVLKTAGNNSSPDPMKLCGSVLGELGLPPETANPIVARSIAAHLKLRDRRNIL
ncbi:Zn-dependent hydrolase, glyoxylase [Candidatus Sulfobium mesophilum]|uniref:Zn-dependent hydrolase, glyoxylase n=1 Tax=Candidatus Sulfobium mesophilum TaxID=2016548 RepID=A0A2U3QKE7_9BACT|nr:Zn-dependent hydrolase, glyoxylase [Candidatus Sulfobium mesophilum]